LSVWSMRNFDAPELPGKICRKSLTDS
jgi:hypothetical protein